VVILGAGAVGLMHAKLAKMSGAGRVFICDPSAGRLEICAELDRSLTVVAGDPLPCVMDATGGAGADVVVTACSAAAAQQTALALGALDGRVNFFGGLPKGRSEVALDTNIIHYKQLTLTGTTRSSLGQYRRTLALIGAGVIDIDPLVTHRFALGDIGSAFANAAGGVGLKQAVVF
jgi:L-iditol 2-dehydrogenase